MTIKHQITKTIKCRDNTRSSNAVSGNFIYGCGFKDENFYNCTYCVEEGTLISTINGEIPVENIQDGDLVWSLNSLKEQVELNEAHHTFYRESNSWLEIEVGQLKIVVTPEHPFYIVGKGWVEAQYLTVNDEVLCDA